MNILVIGRGGREHAMVWKIAQSPLVKKIYAAPGNCGMKTLAECVSISETDTEALVRLAREKAIDLCFVGPESALVIGIADAFQAANIPVFGPTQAAAQIESSKEFAKKIMAKYQIPTARYESFTDYENAVAYVKQEGTPIVIKYDGLAAGKGVVVAMNFEEADIALKDMLLNTKFGEGKVIIEEFLEGTEFSLLAFVHGENMLPMVIAQDHKRAFDGDRGANTGGMGVYAPVDSIPKQAVEEAIERVMKPAVKAMIQEGCPFTGVLYGGLMLTQNGVKTIEFNCRFGDPETEVVLPKMKSDMVEVVLSLLNGKPASLEFYDDYFVGVVMASKGYPESSKNGFEIKNIPPDKLIFHMGTAEQEGKIMTNGGRVLCVTGQGNTLVEARENAYQTVNEIDCGNLFYRNDIGKKS